MAITTRAPAIAALVAEPEALDVMKSNQGAIRPRTALAVGVLIALGVVSASSARGKDPIVQGGRIEFALPDLSGTLVSSTDPRFAGNVVLIELWATWCPPCISEIPTLTDLQVRYGSRGLVVVGIAFEAEEEDGERRARLREFVEKQGINYLVLDGGQPESFETALPTVKNVRGFPVEILIDRGGSVVVSRNGYGFKNKWAAKLRREVEALVGSATE